MASVDWFAARKTWRISYRLRLNGRSLRKAKYAREKAQAKLLKRHIERVEDAVRTGVGRSVDIEEWIERGYLKAEEADQAFLGYRETVKRRRQTELSKTDYSSILAAYEEYALDVGKGGPDRKSHRNHMSMARQVVGWLETVAPDLTQLSADQVAGYLAALRRQYSEWTVYHHLTKLRILLDQAVAQGMINENPARKVGQRQPRKANERRILSEEEVREVLEVSLKHRQLISGGLPAVVRLGLYAGLRDEEMCWLKWEAIDWTQRILSIKESVCEVTQRQWVPKDYESRRLDVKEACIVFLEEERERQKGEGILGQFVLPSGHWKQPYYRNRPLTQEAPQKAFAKMVRAEGMDTAITVYCLRHTFATMALRAGVDLRTLQQRMGHSDIRTTMEYLHHIEPEQHPLDKLPY